MKHSGTLALLACLFLATIWWNWPDWGRWRYWFPEDRRIVIIPGCQRGQLTTMRPHDGGFLSPIAPIALNESAALAIFERPADPLAWTEARFAESLADIPRRVQQFPVLIAQGHVVRVPEGKLVRYVQPSKFAGWIVEVEVFRKGDERLRGFAHWNDLDCWKFE